MPRAYPAASTDCGTLPVPAKMQSVASAADASTEEDDGAGSLQASDKHTFRIRKPWHDTEDTTLRALVNVLGVGRWADLARKMGTERTGKQCRERWHNHLSPVVDKNEWREEEDRTIAEGVARLGPKCALFAFGCLRPCTQFRSLDPRADCRVRDCQDAPWSHR